MSAPVMFQAQVQWPGGTEWVPVGPAMKHRLFVEANVDGYREQSNGQGLGCDFRIVEVSA